MSVDVATSAPEGAPEGEALLAVEDLRVRHGTRVALDGLALRLERGEILGLLGPNGSGKSTLLAVLAGLIRPERGSVHFAGRRLDRADRPYRSRTGVVFQTPSLDPKLTGRENLRLAGGLRGLRGRTLTERVGAGLREAGLESRGADSVETYSGGMKRRLDLARAMLHEPELVLADEPTTGLDEASFQRTWRQLAARGDAPNGRGQPGSAVLLSTHRPEEARRCDRLAVLSEGRVIAVDTPAALEEQVRGEWVVLGGPDPAALRDVLADRLGTTVELRGDEVLVACERAHEMIVEAVRAAPEGAIRSVTVRRPGLAEAFLRLTGTSLEADDTATAREAT